MLLDLPYLAATFAFFAPLSTSVIAACYKHMEWLVLFLLAFGAIASVRVPSQLIYELPISTSVYLSRRGMLNLVHFTMFDLEMFAF